MIEGNFFATMFYADVEDTRTTRASRSRSRS
jgi:hypothetical protein